MNHIWHLWSFDDCLPSLCFMTSDHFVWVPWQHWLKKTKDFFLKISSSKPLKQYDYNFQRSSETSGTFEVKFQVEPSWDRGTKNWSNGPDHLTKMAAMNIYGENLQNSSFLNPMSWLPSNLVWSFGDLGSSYFVQMMTLGWPWFILCQGQICSLMLLYGKSGNC